MRHAKDLINSTMDLKMEIDPDYIYDTWLVESRKLKQKCWFLEWNVEDPVKFLMGNED